MQLVNLEAIRHRVQVGIPLPFNVRLSDETLLLARGQVLSDEDELVSLLERGVLVDLAELEPALPSPKGAAASELPKLWERSIDRAAQVLASPVKPGYADALEAVAEPLMELVEREPDLAIFHVLRQHGNRHAQYGVNHAIHCGIAAFLAARRMEWQGPVLQRAFKAALTMNLSMLELQGELATQLTPLTDEQRAAIRSHPLRSVDMLRLGGVGDAEWLQAVAEHHEAPDGSGYPHGRRSIAPLAALLQRCDIYTAKLSPRRSREALAADAAAARGLYAASQTDPLNATVSTALIKEFGLYPPGCFVRLASGETGVVVRRGPQAHLPQVLLLNSHPGPPIRRDTADKQYAIVCAIGDGAAMLVGRLPDGFMEAVCG